MLKKAANAILVVIAGLACLAAAGIAFGSVFALGLILLIAFGTP